MDLANDPWIDFGLLRRWRFFCHRRIRFDRFAIAHDQDENQWIKLRKRMCKRHARDSDSVPLLNRQAFAKNRS